MATEKTDVVIVGMGAAGGILAAELGKAGIKVIGLERGPRLTTADFSSQDELRYFQRQELRPNAKRQPVTWRPNANARAIPLPILNYGNQAGGGTVHYGAVSWRFHEDDFRARSQTMERYGASAIPKDSSLVDWPLTYAELEPFYDRAEYEIGVSGKAGNLQGRKIDGGNVFEAPRRREFPLPPLVVDQAGANFEAATRKLGYHPLSTPRAIVSQPYNGRPACSYCRRPKNFRAASPIRAGTLRAISCPISGRGRLPPSTTGTSTSTWDRARRSTPSTTSTPSTSTTRIWASCAAPRFRPAPPAWK